MPVHVQDRDRRRPSRTARVSAAEPRHGWLAILVLAASLVADRSAGARTSCPLTTSVWPFETTTSARYDVTIVDGSLGDLDGAVDGSCEVSLDLCGASALCDGAPFDTVTIRASGGDNPLARTEFEQSVQHALDTGAAESGAGGTSASGCSATRLHLAAREDASLALRFRVGTHRPDGRTVLRRSRLMLHCVGGDPALPAAKCRNARDQCPGYATPVCGNGVVDQPGEKCDGTDAQACPGSCTAACTCSSDPAGPGSPQPPGVPTCGDGARNAVSEDCDGSDDSVCPGACRPDCTCGTVSGNEDVAPQAFATASSQESDSPASAAIDGVVGGMPGNPVHEWAPQPGDGSAWLKLTWPTPVTIDRVILHDRPNGVDNVVDGALVVDDGDTMSVGALPPDGSPSTVMLGARTITSLTFVVMQAAGTSAGLAEIEAVKTAAKPTTTTTTTTTPSTTAPSTTSTTLPATSGPTLYISPSGNDAASGTSASAPLRTFAKAIPLLKPGYTLVLADGTYTRGTTGYPSVNCTTAAKNGTADQPITIRATNERRAYLKGDGVGDAFFMKGCNYWNVVGIRASSADNTSAQPYEGNVFRIVQTGHVQVKRALAVRPNRTCPNGSLSYCNAHAIAVESSHDLLIEESEAYDFHRHGISIFASKLVTVRRCYLNSRGAPGAGGGPTAVIFYGASDSIIENTIGEDTVGLNIAGTTVYDGTPGGYRNRLLGDVMLGNRYGSTIRARNFGGPVLPVGHNTVKDSVFGRTDNVGVFSRGAAATLLENDTFFASGANGWAADQDLGEKAPCSANPEGCSITVRNVLSFSNGGKGGMVDTSVVSPWLVEYSDFAGNSGGNYPTSETMTDASGNIQNSMSAMPSGMGLGAGLCLLWPPAGSNVKGRGRDGKDIGATVLYRYQDGVLTTTPLWDRTTGAFPCGAVVAGVNDVAGESCSNVNTRLNVNTNGCTFPANY